MGGLTVRGPTVRLRVRSKLTFLPRVRPVAPLNPPFRSSKPTLSPQAPSVSPGCLSPKPTLGTRAPQFSATVLLGAPARSRSCPPRAPAPARNSRSLAAYLARYGEHGS